MPGKCQVNTGWRPERWSWAASGQVWDMSRTMSGTREAMVPAGSKEHSKELGLSTSCAMWILKLLIIPWELKRNLKRDM